MSLVFHEIHPSPEEGSLNQEWFVLENGGPTPFNSAGCSVLVNRARQGARKNPSALGTLDPGFVLKPGERVRVITGSPGKKSQGEPPAEGDNVKNYHLFLAHSVLMGAGCEIRVALRQHEVARGTFDPQKPNGLAG